ncbi:MAG: hypothetical protein IH968_11390 [Gemmatimonadetes bacterium]|nr:hypothetical protein [Gemmatimonadota bacterium]
MTRLATDGVGMAEASGTVDAEWRSATRAIARHAPYGMSLQPAAARDGGADSERRHGPGSVGRNQRNESCHDQRETRYHGSPADSPALGPFDDGGGGLRRRMPE